MALVHAAHWVFSWRMGSQDGSTDRWWITMVISFRGTLRIGLCCSPSKWPNILHGLQMGGWILTTEPRTWEPILQAEVPRVFFCFVCHREDWCNLSHFRDKKKPRALTKKFYEPEEGLWTTKYRPWNTATRWWFQIFFMFTPIWGNDPIWLIFFKWVETTD